jgi:hypothetical protein
LGLKIYHLATLLMAWREGWDLFTTKATIFMMMTFYLETKFIFSSSQIRLDWKCEQAY